MALLCINHHLLGNLSITTTALPTANCNGQISIAADGTAGPFEIQITSNGNLIHTFLQVDGTITVDDLCTQDYQVSAINRFGCSHCCPKPVLDFLLQARIPANMDVASILLPHHSTYYALVAKSCGNAHFYWTFSNNEKALVPKCLGGRDKASHKVAKVTKNPKEFSARWV